MRIQRKYREYRCIYACTRLPTTPTSQSRRTHRAGDLINIYLVYNESIEDLDDNTQEDGIVTSIVPLTSERFFNFLGFIIPLTRDRRFRADGTSDHDHILDRHHTTSIISVNSGRLQYRDEEVFR